MRLAVNHFRNPVLEAFTNTYWGILQHTEMKKPIFIEKDHSDRIRILLADDDSDDREFFTEVMTETIPNALITTAANGSDLISAITDGSCLPDIIFLDLNMPCKNGQECLKEIKKMKQLRNIPVVMYSTSSSRTDVENAYKEGANLYVKKPNTYGDMQKIALKAAALVEAMRSTIHTHI